VLTELEHGSEIIAPDMVRGKTMRRFLRDERGATAIEYALIAVIISIVVVGGATTIGTSLKTSFQSVSSGFSSSR
jgi:pilus assembly protein Flp/PilA